MSHDQREVCVCFHITVGKIAKYHRLHGPRLASDYANCYGAGTGCAWCVPFLERIFEQIEAGEEPRMALSREEYLERRCAYHQRTRPSLTEPPKRAPGEQKLNPDALLDEIPDAMKLD